MARECARKNATSTGVIRARGVTGLWPNFVFYVGKNISLYVFSVKGI